MITFPKYVVVCNRFKFPVLEQDDVITPRNHQPGNSPGTTGPTPASAEGTTRKTSPITRTRDQICSPGVSAARGTSYTPRLGSGYVTEIGTRSKSTPRYGFGIENEIQAVEKRLNSARIAAAPTRVNKYPKKTDNITTIKKVTPKRAVTCINIKFSSSKTKSHSPLSVSFPSFAYDNFSSISTEIYSPCRIKYRSERTKAAVTKPMREMVTNGFTKDNPGVSNSTQILLERSITHSVVKFPTILPTFRQAYSITTRIVPSKLGRRTVYSVAY